MRKIRSAKLTEILLFLARARIIVYHRRMREVFTDIDSAKVGFYKSALEQAGIPCFVRNEFSNTVMTSIPSHLFYPTLCVTHDDDFEAAVEVLRNFHSNPPPWDPDWACPHCGETVPGNFEECWQCGAEQAETV